MRIKIEWLVPQLRDPLKLTLATVQSTSTRLPINRPTARPTDRPTDRRTCLCTDWRTDVHIPTDVPTVLRTNDIYASFLIYTALFSSMAKS